MRIDLKYIFLILAFCVLSFSCRQPRKISTSFYYWKTVYKANKTENSWLGHFRVKKLYVRIMDVDWDDYGISPVPVSPVIFKDKLPDSLQIVPVVFIANEVLKNETKLQLSDLANKILRFVKGKVEQAEKTSFNELQIDCDWTATTRDNYFYLLNQLKLNPLFKHTALSATLRLHQLKNEKSSGVPPVNRVMLMCYNMGNLRKYGRQNSILEITELQKYAGTNISSYPLPLDVGLPLFHWAVAFRNKQYAGISKRIKIVDLHDKNQFIFIGNNIYKAATELPAFGLNKGDEIRWEESSTHSLQAAAEYLSSLIKAGTLNIIYFHLDENIIKPYNYADLEKVNDLFR